MKQVRDRESYYSVLERFQGFCREAGLDFRQAASRALRQFMRRHAGEDGRATKQAAGAKERAAAGKDACPQDAGHGQDGRL